MNTSVRNKLFVMMILEIAIWGAWQVKLFSYMPLMGFETWQTQLAGSMFGIASLVGIFFSNQFADRHFAAEKFLAVSHLIGGIGLMIAAFANSFNVFFPAFLLYGLFYVPTISVTNSIAFANLKDPAHEFGFVRMGGTIGWIVVSWPFIFLLGEKASLDQMRWIFIVAAIISFVLAGFSLTLPHTPPKREVAGADRLAWLKAFRLLKHPFILILFVVTFLDSMIHNGYFVLVDNYLANAVKLPQNWTNVITTIGQVAEIVTMVILGKVLLRLGWKWTMVVGILGHAVRFAVFAFFGSAEYQWLIIVIQVLHGICYAFFFATLYIFVDEVFPKDIRTSAQGMFNLLILGVGLVAASFFFVYVSGAWLSTTPITNAAGEVVKDKMGQVQMLPDYQKIFLIPTAMAVAAMALLVLFFRPPSERPAAKAQAAPPH